MDAETRAAALRWLQSGAVTLPEIARLLGVSTHVVWNWCLRAGIDWRKARNSRITREWRKEQGRGPRLVEKAKARGSKAHGR